MANGRYRWYDEHGNVYADMTIEEGIERGLYPSVTTILDILKRHDLDRWREEQLIRAAAETRRSEYKDDTLWMSAVRYRADAISRAARNRGLEWHHEMRGKIALMLKRKGYDDITWGARYVNAELGYAGEVDGLARVGTVTDVIELKTTHRKEPVIFDEWVLQVAAYVMLSRSRRGIVLIMGPEQTIIGERIIEDAELDIAERTFLSLLDVWWWLAHRRKERGL
jgi:hypothetical protein